MGWGGDGGRGLRGGEGATECGVGSSKSFESFRKCVVVFIVSINAKEVLGSY